MPHPLFACTALLACLLAGCAADRSATMVRPGGIHVPGDHVGLPERFGAGNVDQYGERAYNRWGAGYDEGVRASDRKHEANPRPQGADRP